ncbi:ARM repeat-containing protein [Mycena indigotica]|uniref:ARM repeat-containing protein n=1 Tax=Mycena indigotica TaxID=2126181 RepID=A0A8H6VS29_9AGAR|nr:ARM repeat-containing protein [Mycena indigotica]KAF7289951.1 ARM repeat-containing protein [Mycena indigotica]
MAASADVQAVLAAIDVFSRALSKVSLHQANDCCASLTDVWPTYNVLLRTSETPVAAKLFTAPTFRAK